MVTSKTLMNLFNFTEQANHSVFKYLFLVAIKTVKIYIMDPNLMFVPGGMVNRASSIKKNGFLALEAG